MFNDDKITGQWTDKDGSTLDVHFGKVWRGHEWSDEEAQKLLAGEKVILSLTSKAGKHYKMACYLDHQQFTDSEGKVIKGVWVTGDFVQDDKVPDAFLGHSFTPEEKTALEGGQEIEVNGLKSKKGNTFDAKLKYGDKTYKGRHMKGIIMSFND